jgi:hypothetical protein
MISFMEEMLFATTTGCRTGSCLVISIEFDVIIIISTSRYRHVRAVDVVEDDDLADARVGAAHEPEDLLDLLSSAQRLTFEPLLEYFLRHVQWKKASGRR